MTKIHPTEPTEAESTLKNTDTEQANSADTATDVTNIKQANSADTATAVTNFKQANSADTATDVAEDKSTDADGTPAANTEPEQTNFGGNRKGTTEVELSATDSTLTDTTKSDDKNRDRAIAERFADRISSAWSLGVARLKEIVKAPTPKKKNSEKPISRTLSLTTFFALLIMAEVLIIVAGSSGILELIHTVFDGSRNVHDLVWLVGISVILGIATTVFLIRFFSAPILTLGASIKKVAGGDFSVRLDTDRGFTELRRISRDFNSMVEELEATEILQTNFVSNVSHEFKTPITAIEGYATLLGGSEGTSPEQAEYINKILLNTNRLSTLVGNILLLSKVDNQGIPDKKSLFRLDEQIRQSILSLEPRWTEKECEFDVEMDELLYEGNEALTFHVWNNLIENAIKFGPHGGCIRITLSKVGEELIFSVSDEGEGVSPEAKLHVFDRFYQTDSSHKAEGNGLGLALVKQIIEVEGGRVAVSDNLPKGAIFTVALKAPKPQ